MSTNQIKQTLSAIESELRAKIGALPEMQAKLMDQQNYSLCELIQVMTDVHLCEHPLFIQLMSLDAARCQLEIGLYGVCSDCENEIEAERLAEDPLEQRCASCSGQYRRQHRQELRLNH
ncbi:TraR/DksA C4-type zinc finger protein [Shewanella pealeana]|uniref:Transcriptional regulator, TraR/DksA family n=1 Tax=Shewanella pealeana (strain ATCC 700345 / ANG-SQ1) TaxID=398579 RepID=A8H2N8_SHEPA|nr:TraR/DksA C4-type zinc finger protein [Shewanella pealeana]ABV86825.1 transcriptional regulator, TraR/DksA family [Shewanella pealeana ATCC 700345]